MKRLLIVLLAIVPACSSDPAGDDGGHIQPAPDANPGPGSDADPGPTPDAAGPDPTPDANPDPVAHGTYDVVTEVDVTTSAVLPEMAYQYYDLLRRFRENPAEAIVYALDQAGVPLVQDLYDMLPSFIETRIEGWINDYVNTVVFGGTPVGPHLDLILQYGEMALTQFDVVTELDLATPTSEHRLVAFRFHIGGETIDVPVPSDAPPPFAVEATVATTITGSSVQLGDHAFGAEFGKLAWVAFQEAVRRRYGTSLREVLGTAIDCTALASSVAGQCYMSVCVGHQSQLEGICETGLDELVSQMQERVEGIAFHAIRFAVGNATVNENRLDDGVWTASIDAGMGPRSVPATFTGVRR